MSGRTMTKGKWREVVEEGELNKRIGEKKRGRRK